MTSDGQPLSSPEKVNVDTLKSRLLQWFALSWSLRHKVFPGNRLLTICKVLSPLVWTYVVCAALWFT